MKGTERPAKILQAIEQAGCELVRIRDGIKVLAPNGKVYIVHSLHGHKGSHCATKQFLHELRRDGIEI